MAMELPEVSEGVGSHGGGRTWTVPGKPKPKVFAWERGYSKADLKRLGDEPPKEGPNVALRTADLGEKEAILASGLKGAFTIEHFNGYPAVLIQLKAVHKRALREAIIDGWSACAPARLARDA